MTNHTHTCENCGIGHYRAIRVPYLMPLGKRMMVMPDAPAYRCDVCSFRTFDSHFLASVHLLMKQVTEDPQRNARRRQRLQAEPVLWEPARRTR